jgi:hypothetical protein
MIVDTFYNRMRFHLQSEDLATVFINIEEILRVNRRFLLKLSPVVMRALGLEINPEPFKNGNESKPLQISDVFLSFKMHFTIYAIYCSRLDASAKRIEELERTDPNMKQIITVHFEDKLVGLF